MPGATQELSSWQVNIGYCETRKIKNKNKATKRVHTDIFSRAASGDTGSNNCHTSLFSAAAS